MEVLRRIKNFRQPKKLQIEALTFLVNQSDTKTFDFKKLRNAFRTMDTDNSGTLQLSEIRTAFNGLNMSEEELNAIFDRIDFNHDGEINYTEFLAVTVDRRKAVTDANMTFAFHHFDIDNSGFITEANLNECFRREGKHLDHDELQEMLSQIQCATPGKVTFQEFKTFMNDIVWTDAPSQ